MKTFLTALVLTTAFAAQAQNLECHLRMGKFEIQPMVAGTLSLVGGKAIYTSVAGDVLALDFVSNSSTRTGVWARYEAALAEGHKATLVTEAEGASRRTNISVAQEDGTVISALLLKCLE